MNSRLPETVEPASIEEFEQEVEAFGPLPPRDNLRVLSRLASRYMDRAWANIHASRALLGRSRTDAPQ